MKNYIHILVIGLGAICSLNSFLHASGQPFNSSITANQPDIQIHAQILATKMQALVKKTINPESSELESEDSGDKESSELSDRIKLLNYKKKVILQTPGSLQDQISYYYAKQLPIPSVAADQSEIDASYIEKTTNRVSGYMRTRLRPNVLYFYSDFCKSKDPLFVSKQIASWVIACYLFSEICSKKVITNDQAHTYAALFSLLSSGNAKLIKQKNGYTLKTHKFVYYPQIALLKPNKMNLTFSNYQELYKLYQQGLIKSFGTALSEVSNQLRQISGSVCDISKIPLEIGLCTQLTRLDLTNNEIKTIPDDISKCTHLTDLQLSRNNLKEIPVSLIHLHQLEHINVSNNEIKRVPLLLTSLCKLHTLYLEDNQIKFIHSSIQTLPKLKLEISGNPLKKIPHGDYRK